MRKYAIYVTAATLAIGSLVWTIQSHSESNQSSETIMLDSLLPENSVAVLAKNKNGNISSAIARMKQITKVE